MDFGRKKIAMTENPMPGQPPVPPSTPSVLATVFDPSFNRLISRQILGVVYVIVLVLTGLVGLVMAIRSVAAGGFGILGLLVVPALTIAQMLLVRVVFEAAVVYFRIAEDVRTIRDEGLSRPPR